MNGSRDGAQVPFDDGIGSDAASNNGTGAGSRSASVRKGSGHSIVDMVVEGILELVGGVFLYPLALMIVIVPIALPFIASGTNGSYDANAIYIRLGIAVLCIVGGFAIAVLTVRWYRQNKFLKAVIAALIAVAAFGYGLVCTGSYATALAEGPKTVAVERPTVTREAKSDDDGDYQVCTMTFTPELSFDAGSCEDDGSISANNRIAQDLLHTHSDHVLLHYYDTVTGPIYVGLEDDPQYS